MSVVYCRVPWLCCVDVRGADAYDFLRRQLSNDPPDDDDRFSLAAWNDAHGRVRALFRIVRGAGGPLLIAERDGLDAVLAKLRVFVLRSDVVLEPSGELEIAAVIGDATGLLDARGIRLGTEPGTAARGGGLVWLRQSGELVHVVGPAGELERLRAELASADAAHAAQAEIRAGLPYVGAVLAERYVPQMLNLDRLGGIAFDKGCYPGQEVVTRLRHRGSVKRRLARFVASAAEAPPPGTPVVDADGNEAGDVVRAAAVDGRLELLAVVRLDVPQGPLFVGSGTRVPLEPA
ncbi:MAG TPA: hypothetical protein VF322_02940 [Gammaproteobacteria bacterium]